MGSFAVENIYQPLSNVKEKKLTTYSQVIHNLRNARDCPGHGIGHKKTGELHP